MTLFQLERFVVDCEAQLEKMGINLRVERDLERVLPALSCMGRDYISPILDPARTAFTRTNCFWLFAEQDGVPIVAGGVRCDDLGDEGMDHYLTRALPVIFGVGLTASDDHHLPPALGGRIAYFGDLVASRKSGLGPKAKLIVQMYNICAHHYVWREFRPDVIWCFLRDADYRRGAHKAYGFVGEAPFLHRWHDDPFPSGRPEWVVYNGWQEHLLMMRAAERFMSVS